MTIKYKRANINIEGVPYTDIVPFKGYQRGRPVLDGLEWFLAMLYGATFFNYKEVIILSEWYDPNKTLTHNALFNFIIGNRSSGKSYGLKKRVVKNFKDKGQQFIYLRRYKDELDKSKDSYFDDIIYNNEFPDDKITFENDCYFLNGHLMGYAMALTKAKDYKSSSFPAVWLVIYEEFIIEENGFSRYLKNEVETFLGFYMSIDRYRGCKVFFLGNNYSMFNPYTLYWKLQTPYNSNITKAKGGKILLEMVKAKADERMETDFGQIVEGTPFADYAIQNISRIDNDTFVMKKSEKCSYYFTFKYSDELYGVWVDYTIGKFFVSKDVDPCFKIIYSITLDDHTPNTLLLKSVNKSIFFKTFIENYKSGNVYFENMNIKSVVYNVIRLCVGGN